MTENLYVLTDFSPIGTSDKKTRIILTETKRDYRNYIRSLKYRYNKKNPYLPNYVITKEGRIVSSSNSNCYTTEPLIFNIQYEVDTKHVFELGFKFRYDED